MSAEVQTLSAHRSAPAAFLPWVIVWALAIALVGTLLASNAALDTWAWRATRWAMGSQLERGYDWQQIQAAAPADAPWYLTRTPPLAGKLYKKTETLWRVLRTMGEPYMMLIVAAGVWIYDRRAWRAAMITVAATALAGGIVSLLSATLGRLRPDGVLSRVGETVVRNDGANHWTLLRGFGGGGDLSFPSGHAALAAAVAAVLVYLSPRGRWLFVALACGCALSRVVMQAHFYSDVIMGGLLGYTLAAALARGFDRLLGRPQHT